MIIVSNVNVFGYSTTHPPRSMKQDTMNILFIFLFALERTILEAISKCFMGQHSIRILKVKYKPQTCHAWLDKKEWPKINPD